MTSGQKIPNPKIPNAKEIPEQKSQNTCHRIEIWVLEFFGV
jgi:hypothetical protein